MTAERVKAGQATRPPKAARLLRGTVAQVSPLTVQIAGGAAVAGLPLPGVVYTVGDPVLILWQEPLVGPVHPLTITTPPLVSATGALDFTGTTASNQATGLTELSRLGDQVTLNAYINLGSAGAAAGTKIATLPAGFRPRGSRSDTWNLWSSAAWKGVGSLEIGTDGAIVVQWLSAAMAAGQGIFGTATFLAA